MTSVEHDGFAMPVTPAIETATRRMFNARYDEIAALRDEIRYLREGAAHAIQCIDDERAETARDILEHALAFAAHPEHR